MDEITAETIKRISEIEKWRDSLQRQETGMEWKLLAAVLSAHKYGGGALMEGWLADSCQSYGLSVGAATPGQWAAINIEPIDYYTTINGGPYVDLDGIAERFSFPDASWNEAGATNILTWRWVCVNTLASSKTIISKWITATANRSWRLYYNSVAGAFEFVTNATGAAAQDVAVTSTYPVATETWYFVAGFWLASTLQCIYVGAATDTALTIDPLAVGVSATVFDGTAMLEMGCYDLTDYLDGNIGIGATRIAVLDATIDLYVTHLFHLTRWFYME